MNLTLLSMNHSKLWLLAVNQPRNEEFSYVFFRIPKCLGAQEF